MSAVVDYNSIYDHLTIVIVPIQIVLGVLTNIFNIIILSRPSLLRGSPCTHYFLAIAVISILYMIVGSGSQFSQRHFMFKPMNTIVGCKLLPYILTLLTCYVSILLTLAACDRFCQSSTLVYVRRWSSVSVARRAIIGVAIVLPIVLSPTMIVWYINDDYGGLCLSYTDPGATIIVIVQTITADYLPPLMMIVFGLLTIRNIHGNRNRVVPVAGGVTQQRRTEIQLAKMLLWQVLDYLIFFLPIGITYTLAVVKSSMQTEFFGFIINICALWNQFFYSTTFFLYILTGNIYRREFIRIICHYNRLFHRNQAFLNTHTMASLDKHRTVIQ